jgi:hypothetical protein
VLAERRWGFVVLALPLAVTGAFHPSGMVMESGAFLPPFSEWVQSGLFFVFGWYLHRDQERLLSHFAARCKGHALAGLAFFIATIALLGALHGPGPHRLPHPEFWIAFAYNATSWLWSLALIGGFVRYLPRQNAVLAYLSQSSYWVYLVHMLGTIGFGILLFNAPLRRGREDGAQHRGHLARGACELPAAGALHAHRHAAERPAGQAGAAAVACLSRCRYPGCTSIRSVMPRRSSRRCAFGSAQQGRLVNMWCSQW